MSRASFVFNFNVDYLEIASREFPKSNVAEVEGSKWYLCIEKTIRDRCRNLDIFLACDRGTVDGIYLVNTALILRGSLIDLLFMRTYCVEPMDLDMFCFSIDSKCILDKDNGFIDEDGECEIMAEISVRRIEEEKVGEIEEVFRGLKDSCFPPKALNGIIKLQGGHCVRVNKELLSSHSEYFHNVFHNKHFVESSQEAIDLTDFTYEQFRLLYKRIYQSRNLFTDGTVQFRLKSECCRFKEFKRLWNLADVQKYCQRQMSRQTPADSSEKSITETLCMFDDVREMRALLGLICCVSTEYVPGKNQTVSQKKMYKAEKERGKESIGYVFTKSVLCAPGQVSDENVDDLLSVGSYFQISKILDSCKEFLVCRYPTFYTEGRMELLEKYNLTSAERSNITDLENFFQFVPSNPKPIQRCITRPLSFFGTGDRPCYTPARQVGQLLYSGLDQHHFYGKNARIKN
ncbi:BTB/POZ domain-containing protein [Ditylenchus destructor]|nr:BTB/POZ domain-containing protein [Ditylenchus destructor]